MKTTKQRIAATPTPGHPVRLLTTRDAESYCGLSRTTLYRAAWAGELHPLRINSRTTRWPIADLDAWINRSPPAVAVRKRGRKTRTHKQGVRSHG